MLATATLVCYWWEGKWHNLAEKTIGCFLVKWNTHLPCDPRLPLLGISSWEMKTYIHANTCTWMFTDALFIIASSWKQPKCPSRWVGKQIVVYLFNRIPLSNKNEWTLDDPGDNVDESRSVDAEGKKTQGAHTICIHQGPVGRLKLPVIWREDV